MINNILILANLIKKKEREREENKIAQMVPQSEAPQFNTIQNIYTIHNDNSRSVKQVGFTEISLLLQ